MIKSIRFFLILFLAIGLLACKKKINSLVMEDNLESIHEDDKKAVTIDSLIAKLLDSNDDQIIVVAHRGDWRNAPENSVQAIKSCIRMGVDMVEIDVRETKDGKLILMHDETIDRTTNGKGEVANLSWDYLKSLYLKDGLGHITPNKIPKLEEALTECKGKILVNLDKSYAILDRCYKIIEKTRMQNQVIIKGEVPFDKLKKEFGGYIDKIFFMPIVRLKNNDSRKIVDQYLDNLAPVAFEFIVSQDAIKLKEYFYEIQESGASVWVNALWPHLNDGHDDEKAVLNPKIYDWYIDNNIDIIQTDRPKLLIDFLRSKELHK